MNCNPPAVRNGHTIIWIRARPGEDARELLVRLAAMPWARRIVRGKRPSRVGERWAVTVREARA